MAATISIHAPREGSDFELHLFCPPCPISIHAPREGSDLLESRGGFLFYEFLSTLPARGATSRYRRGSGETGHFYPRSPRGERRNAPGSRGFPAKYFYPRSPRGERPGAALTTSTVPTNFYPRSPRGERPRPCISGTSGIGISIHAPREGSDSTKKATCWACPYFYPRSPRGERPGARPRRPQTQRDFYPRSPRGERRRPSWILTAA